MSPPSVQLGEDALRAIVFVTLLWLPLNPDGPGPLTLFALGSVLYMASWAPALANLPIGRHPVIYLLPYATPLIWLLAMAWMGRSWPYAAAALIFVSLHTTHSVLAHRDLVPHHRD